jgi:DivIVA domain-containing protein
VTWLFTLLGMAVIALGAALVTGRISGSMDAPTPSVPFQALPADGVGAGDLATLRFTPVLRGYKMAEVDQVLDRLSDELARRDEEIARLRGLPADGDASVAPDVPDVPDVPAAPAAPAAEATPQPASQPDPGPQLDSQPGPQPERHVDPVVGPESGPRQA